MSAARSETTTLPVVSQTRTATDDRLLRWPEVRRRTGLSRTTVWRLVQEGAFPAPRRLSANVVAWLASEIDAWIASRASARTAATPAEE